MLNHYLTKYTTPNGKKYAESWLQLNVFGKSFCFWKRKIEIETNYEKDWCREITVTKEEELIASITQKNAIVKDGYEVTCR